MKAVVCRQFLMLAIVVAALALQGCNSRIPGTYTDQSGAFVLDLKSDGTATFSFNGDPAKCTYTSSGDQLNLKCQNQSIALTFQKDGSLTGGPLMPPLKKK